MDARAEPQRAEVERDGGRVRGPEARYRAFRRSMRSNPVLDLSWRIGVLSLGGIVLLAGVAMLALPGPGWATIFIGLMILASEFAWARRSLDSVKARARDARERAMAPAFRRRTQMVTVLVAMLLMAGVVFYWQSFGFPGPVGAWIAAT